MPKAFFILSALLFTLWLIINSSLKLPIAITGALVSLVISWIFVRRRDVWGRIGLTPRALWHFVAYTLVFFVELMKANINMVR